MPIFSNFELARLTDMLWLIFEAEAASLNEIGPICARTIVEHNVTME